jgi:hypothetical protein
MPPQTISDVKIDLVKYFSERITASKFYDDYAAIASYLSDPQQYSLALKKLNDEMEVLYSHRLERAYPFYARHAAAFATHFVNQNDYRYLNKAYKTNKPRELWEREQIQAEQAIQQFKKLLTETLAKNELKHGFTIADINPTTDIIVGLPERFNDLLRNKKPFKDIGAGYQHGEYSHRIQWYLITQIRNLNNPAATIYEKLPGWSTKYVEEYSKPRTQRDFYMWEFLVDRDGVPTNAALIPFKTAEQTDFRAPSNLNRWLCDEVQSETYQWLHSSLKRRWDKRSAQILIVYVANKKFQKSYKLMRDIPNEEFGICQEFIEKTAIITR